jgi:hypothetical protein
MRKCLKLFSPGARFGTLAAGFWVMIYPNKNEGNGPVAGERPNVAAGA